MHGVDLDVLPEKVEEGEEEMHGVDLDVLPEVERGEEKESGVQEDPSAQNSHQLNLSQTSA